MNCEYCKKEFTGRKKKYCSSRCRQKNWENQTKNIIKRKAYRIMYRLKNKEQLKKYRSTPEYKKKRSEYRKSPKMKAYRKKYYLRPEVQKRIKEYNKTHPRKYIKKEPKLKMFVDNFLKYFGKRIREEEIEDSVDFYSKYVCGLKKIDQCKLKEKILIEYDSVFNNHLCLTPAKRKEASEILEAQVAQQRESTQSSELPII